MVIARIKLWLYGALTLIGAILGAYVLGRAKESSTARVDRLENELDAMRKAKDVEDEIELLDDVGLAERAAKWVRDSNG